MTSDKLRRLAVIWSYVYWFMYAELVIRNNNSFICPLSKETRIEW